jgi:omega-6 fatty acid desaturase (delta-12 desaturase)
MSAAQLSVHDDLPLGATQAAAVPRSELHRRIAPFAQANSFKGWMSFTIDVAIYALGIAGVLLLDHWAGKVAGALVAGSGLVNLGSLSHEAAHRAVVKSRAGNKFMAVVSLTMILFNYRLWVYDHHVLHHGRTNVKENNFLSPLTLAEFKALSWYRRALYRAYHSPGGLGILLYYMLERWPSVHFYPGAWLPQQHRASAWRYTALETLYGGSLLALLVLVALSRGESVALAVLLGFVVPYAIWFTTFALTAFLQHTNPRLRWYGETSGVASTPEQLSVHVLVPQWLNHMTHYVLEHNVHHIHAMIPHYHLRKAQAVLAGSVGAPIITMSWTLGNMNDVLRRCKLYDYERHVWLDFAGKETGVPDDTRRLLQVQDGLAPYGPQDTSSGVFFPAGHEVEAASRAPVPKEDADA